MAPASVQNHQERIIRQLREEIDKLKAELAAARGGGGAGAGGAPQSDEDKKRLQDMIAALERSQKSVSGLGVPLVLCVGWWNGECAVVLLFRDVSLTFMRMAVLLSEDMGGEGAIVEEV